MEALIPNEIHPQLFAVAMDWCTSQEGIPSLAYTHAYTSDQQRPRRLSSSVAANSTTSCMQSTTSQKFFLTDSTVRLSQISNKNLNKSTGSSTTLSNQNVMGANLKVENLAQNSSKIGVDNPSLLNLTTNSQVNQIIFLFISILL